MNIDHFLILQNVEIIIVDGEKAYVMDRTREELRSLIDPHEILPLCQRQSGRLPDGELEVLVRYQAEDGSGPSVVVDSSPSWLASLIIR